MPTNSLASKIVTLNHNAIAVKTNPRADGIVYNHNSVAVKPQPEAKIVRVNNNNNAIAVKTGIRAGGIFYNHNSVAVRSLLAYEIATGQHRAITFKSC